MKTLKLTQKFALIEYKKSTLENYNPSVILELDTIEQVEELETSDFVDEGCTVGCTIVEKTESGLLRDYYSGEIFDMPTYS